MQFSSTTRASDPGAPGARSAASDVGDNVAALREDIAGLADSVKRLAAEQIGSSVEDVQDKAKEKLGDIEAHIRRNPSQAALVAAGIGFVFGLILRADPEERPMTTQYSPNRTAERQVKDVAGAAQDKFNETVGQAQDFAQEQYDKLAASIRRNPLQAAGIAAGVGFVLALLARR